jgi:uncharacterized membrane protein YkoI
MRARTSPWLLLLIPFLVAAATAAASPAAAEEERPPEHDQARALVEAGIIRPLPEIVAGLGSSLGGRIIEVSLDLEDGRWVYELTLLAEGGQVLEVDVDAVSGALLEDR